MIDDGSVSNDYIGNNETVIVIISIPLYTDCFILFVL